MVESNEQSTLFERDQGYSSTESITRVHFKVYKRRWYVLFVFTAQAFIFNMAWNTWGPIQEPSKVAFDWTDFDLLLLSSWAAIALIATSLPLTWLMDSKGLCFLLFFLYEQIPMHFLCVLVASSTSFNRTGRLPRSCKSASLGYKLSLCFSLFICSSPDETV